MVGVHGPACRTTVSPTRHTTFMLPPAMISLPFKLLLFVLVDGWSLIVQSLITSFR